MQFFRFKGRVYPLFIVLLAVFLIVFGLVMAGSVKCSYFFAGVFVWMILFGMYRQCLKVLPAFVVLGGIFSLISYYAAGESVMAAVAMANRFAGVFLAVAAGMSIEAVSMTRSLSQLHAPRSVTLGMLIAMSFVPTLKTEIGRVWEAMKTRGAGSFLTPRIFYRAFLVPLVMRLVNISDTLSLSVETRGFALGKVPYTIYKRETVTLWDVLFIAGICSGAVLAVVL